MDRIYSHVVLVYVQNQRIQFTRRSEENGFVSVISTSEAIARCRLRSITMFKKKINPHSYKPTTNFCIRGQLQNIGFLGGA